MPITQPPTLHTPGKHVSKENKQWFLDQIRRGHNPYRVGEVLGVGRATARRLAKRVAQESTSPKLHVVGPNPADGSESPVEAAARLADDSTPLGEYPDPRKRYEDLIHPQARQCWNEFGYARTLLFGRRHIPWQIEMVQTLMSWWESGQAVKGTEESEYIRGIINTPPGGGKTTTITHDFPAWVIARWREVRVGLGARTTPQSGRYVRRIRKTLEMNALMNIYFGRFKPLEDDLWRQDQFVVDGVEGNVATIEHKLALAGFDPYNPLVTKRLEDPEDDIHEILDEIANIFLVGEKEPTVQAFSQDKGFLGNRVDLNLWDDLCDKNNSKNADQREALSEWWFAEAESRTEPGGIVGLIGTRFGKFDLYRHCRDLVYVAEDEIEEQMLDEVTSAMTDEQMQQVREDLEKEMVDKYGYEYGELATPDVEKGMRRSRHIYHYFKFPAHDKVKCEHPDSIRNVDHVDCVLDPKRFSYRHLAKVESQDPRKFQLTYQQEDESTEENLVQQAWLAGGVAKNGMTYPGCYNYERRLLELPEDFAEYDMVSVATVDPSAQNWWSIQWWLWDIVNDVDYLMDIERARLSADSFLSYDIHKRQYKGIANDWTDRSRDMDLPIALWIIEDNAAQRYLFQHTWVAQWMKAKNVIIKGHKTHRNKPDPELGIEILKPRYRDARVDLPFDQDDIRTRVKVTEFARELMEWPDGQTEDMVMGNWFYESNKEYFNTHSFTIGARSGHTRSPTRHPFADTMPGYMNGSDEEPEGHYENWMSR